MKEYKVLTQRDFGKKFDSAKVEEVLNAYAKEGWELKAAVSTHLAGFVSMSPKDELVVFLEREKQ